METAENTAPVETTEVDSEVETTPGAGPAPAGTEAAASGDDTSTWTEKAQKRYDELTERRHAAEARADREAYRREQLERELQELRTAATAKTETVAPSEDPPDLWDEGIDGDKAKHKAALSAWVRAQTAESVQSVLAEEREAAERQQSERDWSRREAEYIKANPDYAAKVKVAGQRGEWACTEDMAMVMRQSELGPQIATYLAENAAKSFEIARLPPALQAREIGRIEARLEAAKAAPPPVSKAPPPVAKIDAGDSSGEKDPKDMTRIQYAKWRKQHGG